MPARLLLLCLLFRRPWLTAEGGRHVGTPGVLHRPGRRAAVAAVVAWLVTFQRSTVGSAQVIGRGFSS
ncbi:MAG: hypothetical protein ACXVH3_28855 [Solirubrobacteraceae bacterium]